MNIYTCSMNADNFEDIFKRRDIQMIKDYIRSSAVCREKAVGLLWQELEKYGVTNAKLLINAGLDVNTVTIHGFTLLGLASSKGLLDVVELLLDLGANPGLKAISSGMTPLLLACQHGHYFVVEKLSEEKECKPRSETDKEGRSALHLTAAKGHLQITKYLVQSKKLSVHSRDSEGATPLFRAAESNQHRTMGYLLSKGANPGQCLVDGRTALWLASKHGFTDIAKVLIHEILMHWDHGSLNEADTEGRTPLYMAVAHGKSEIAQLLVNAGCDVNWRKLHVKGAEHSGDSPLLRAITNGDMDILQILLKTEKCDVNLPFENEDMTPLHWAVHLDSVRTNDWYFGDSLEHPPIRYLQVIHQLLAHPSIRVNTMDPNHGSPLSTACNHGSSAVVKLLLKNYADVNMPLKQYMYKDNGNRVVTRAIDWAFLKGHADIVKLLLESDARPNFQTWTEIKSIREKMGDPKLQECLDLISKADKGQLET